MGFLKNKIKENIFLKLFICFTFRKLNAMVSFNTFGSNSKIQISNLALLYKVKFKVKGGSNKIIIEEGVALKNLKIEVNGNNNLIELKKDVRFYEDGKILIEGDNCQVVINDKTTIGSANLFCEESNKKIIIGNDCMLSRNITIQTGDFHSIIDESTKMRINKSSDIIIGNHVWIGNQALILKGAIISDNSIVGISSLVNKNFSEKNIIIAGFPAKILKSNINWKREKLAYD
jgi:acetyltransferase-like isoleucine patch superfamily enzyme